MENFLETCFVPKSGRFQKDVNPIHFSHLNTFFISMKYFLVCSLLLSTVFSLHAQGRKLPDVNVKTPEGQTVKVQDLAPAGKITVFSFWATWCKPCVAELDAIKDLYPEWQEKYNVEFVAVSVDDARTTARVKTFVANKGWDFKIVTDTSKEFQLAMNVPNPPLTIVVNQKGEIVYDHLGYNPGDELELEEKIKAIAGGK